MLFLTIPQLIDVIRMLNADGIKFQTIKYEISPESDSLSPEPGARAQFTRPVSTLLVQLNIERVYLKVE